MPDCDNFGVPACPEHARLGPSVGRDPHYKVESTKRGTVLSIRCKSCWDNPPIKSNAAIAAEIHRLTDMDGLLRLEETTGCRQESCENHNLPIASNHRHYLKKVQIAGRGQRYQCKACGSKVLLSQPIRLHDNHQRLAADIFSRIADKSPVRGTVRGVGLVSNQSYYDVLTFIHDRCRAYFSSCGPGLDGWSAQSAS